MPERYSYADMMRELITGATGTYKVEPFDLTLLAHLPVSDLRLAAQRTAYYSQRTVYVHRGAIWVSRSIVDRVLAKASTPTATGPRTAFGHPLRIYSDRDAWRWDLGHVAQARAHAELCAIFVSPLRRLQRRLERFARRTS